MRDFLRLPDDVKRAAYLQVEQSKGLAAASVEKDLWVCLTLRELFSLPGIGEKLTFKGGTSLSKAWDIIERFSEDIDIVVDKDLLGISRDESPATAQNNSQRDRRLRRLEEASAKWISEGLIPALLAKMDGLGCKITLLPEVAGCVSVEYPSVFAKGAERYVSPVVKIELGARPENYPNVERTIVAYVLADNPKLSTEREFGVRVISSKRTFWEKVCLLHEERLRPAGRNRRPRLSRHYYDIWCLSQKGVAAEAIADSGLFSMIVDDRKVSYNVSWVQYDQMTPGALRIMPTDADLAAWRSDYEKMREEMFFGDSPEFDQLMEQLRELEGRLNGAGR